MSIRQALVDLFRRLTGRHVILDVVRTREGFTHSFPVLKLPAESCWLFTTADKAEAVDVINVLYGGGFAPHLGESRDTVVVGACRVLWTVFVDGDAETVAAAREWLKRWRNGEGV